MNVDSRQVTTTGESDWIPGSGTSGRSLLVIMTSARAVVIERSSILIWLHWKVLVLYSIQLLQHAVLKLPNACG